MSVSEPVKDVIQEMSEVTGRTESDIARQYVVEGLEEDGYLDHLDEKVNKRIRNKFCDEMDAANE